MATALSERISRIRELVHRLGEIIAAETAVLRKRQPSELADPEKGAGGGASL